MLLFVYGSLRRGQLHHDELAGARYVGTATTEACYELVDLGPYPALIRDGATAVVGELYEVDDALLSKLDAFEEAPDVYRRAPVRIAGVHAETYFMPRTAVGQSRRVASGDWRQR